MTLRRWLILTLVGAIAVAASLVLLPLWAGGFSARENPTAVEAFVARLVRRLAIPAGAREMRNPVVASGEVLAEAQEHFADHCATCHGNDGRGDTTMGRNLFPKPPDMASRTGPTQALTDGELFFYIKNGIRLSGMPAWGADSPEDDLQSWKLVQFIRHLPDITAAELREMEEMNPKSAQEREEENQIRDFLEGGSVPPTHSPGNH